MEALSAYLDAKEVELEKLFLDPNNPRFVGKDWTHIPDKYVSLNENQQTARETLIRTAGIEKLRMNMELNGYLPIDRIVVRSIGDGNYVVLEGNRRICAAKTLAKYTADGAKVDESVQASLTLIPCLEYTGTDENASWIFQGLRHISGIVDWSAYNKARLLVEQMENEGLSLTVVGQRFGLSAFGAGQWVRGYKAFMQASEETDYTSEIDEKIYPYFQELFGRSSIKMREWLGWNEDEYAFKRIDLLNEFISWFYPRDLDNEGDPNEASSVGDWEKRKIGKRDDIRQLSYLIETSPKNFKLFRDRGDVEEAYAQAVIEDAEKNKRKFENAESDLFVAIEECVKAIRNTPVIILKDTAKKEKLDAAIVELSDAIKLVSD